MRKLFITSLFTLLVGLVYGQSWTTVTLNGVAQCAAIEIKNYDYGSGNDRFILYFFTTTSSNDINCGLIKIDNSNNIIFNKSYQSSTSSSQLVFNRIEIDNNGNLFALGAKKIGATTYEPELLKIDPSNGSIIYAKKLSGFYSGYDGFTPSDIYLNGTEILITGVCQNRFSSSSPLTKTMVIRYNPSTSTNSTDEFANNSNPSQHTFGATHFVDVWSTGYSLGGWFNSYPSGPPTKPGYIYCNPSSTPSSYVYDISVTGEDVRQFTWGAYDGWPYMVMRYNNNFDDFTICRFEGLFNVDWTASYSFTDLGVIPDPSSADRLEGFPNLNQQSVMNLQGNVYRSSSSQSTYRFYFGQFSVTDGSIVTSKVHTLRVPFFPISPTLGSDPINTGSTTRATTAFANRYPSAPTYSDVNKFYYFPEIETSNGCDQDISLTSISKSVSTSSRSDIQFSSISPATIADDNTISSNDAGTVSLTSVCSEVMREESDIDPEKVVVFDNVIPEFPQDDLSSSNEQRFAKDKEISKEKEIKSHLKIYRNGEIIVAQSNNIIKSLEICSLDGKRLLFKTDINLRNVSINFPIGNNIILVRVVYSDGKFAIKKLLNW